MTVSQLDYINFLLAISPLIFLLDDFDFLHTGQHPRKQEIKDLFLYSQ